LVFIVDKHIHPLIELLRQDQRYHLDAYKFVRESLTYAQEVLQFPGEDSENRIEQGENHITGQQLCEAIRLYAVEQFGYMAQTVLNAWGVYSTGDFGEIVYNLIRIKHMKKSKHDRREDFDKVYDFSTAFDPNFELAGNDE
jgi:uncharacterized repeat protein (TIGR04138 family)